MYDPLSHNPFVHISEHPLPETDDEAYNFQADRWYFPPPEMVDRNPDYLSAAELQDTHLEIESQCEPWEIHHIPPVYGDDRLIWHTEREAGFRIKNKKGRYYSFARALGKARLDDDTTLPNQTFEGETEDEVAITPIGSHPLLLDRDERRALQEEDDTVSAPDDGSVIHPDALAIDYRTKLASTSNTDLFTTMLSDHENVLFWWDTELSQGVRINTALCDVKSLADALIESLGEEDVIDSGSRPLDTTAAREAPN